MGIGFDGRRNAAHTDVGGGARHAPVLAGPVRRRQRILTLGEDVDGDARDRDAGGVLLAIAGAGGDLGQGRFEGASAADAPATSSPTGLKGSP